MTYFLLRLSVTTHSTWSRRQLVHGEPFSTTSQRTLRARQQQQARDALRLIGRFAADRPAAEAFLLFCGDAISGGGEEVVEAILSEHREGCNDRVKSDQMSSKSVHINAKPVAQLNDMSQSSEEEEKKGKENKTGGGDFLEHCSIPSLIQN